MSIIANSNGLLSEAVGSRDLIKEEQMKKELEIEKMAKEEKLEIVEKKKETEEAQCCEYET